MSTLKCNVWTYLQGGDTETDAGEHDQLGLGPVENFFVTTLKEQSKIGYFLHDM